MSALVLLFGRCLRNSEEWSAVDICSSPLLTRSLKKIQPVNGTIGHDFLLELKHDVAAST